MSAIEPALISLLIRSLELFLAILEQYILGLTSQRENEEIESYANLYPEVKAEIEALQEAVEGYALQYAISPKKDIKQDILSEISQLEMAGEKVGTEPSRSINRWVVGAVAASFALLLFSVLSLYNNNQQLNTEYEALGIQFETFKSDCEDQQARQKENLELFALLQNNTTVPVRLKGLPLAPDAQAIVYWNKDQEKAVLNIVDLPTPPQGKQYQMWADVEGEMISMGVFDFKLNEFQELAFIENPESFNITLEPIGGSDHPTVSQLHANGEV